MWITTINYCITKINAVNNILLSANRILITDYPNKIENRYTEYQQAIIIIKNSF